MRAILYRIGDKDLTGLAEEIDNSYLEMVKLITAKSSGDEQVDRFGIVFLSNAKFEDAMKAHGKFIKRLDQLKSDIIA